MAEACHPVEVLNESLACSCLAWECRLREQTEQQQQQQQQLLLQPSQLYPIFYIDRPLLFYLNSELHWLPVNSRITFKLACFTYKLLTTGQPAYLHMLLHQYTPTRTLWSTNQFFLDVPQFYTEFGKRSFSYLAPTVWNGWRCGLVVTRWPRSV